MRILLTPLDARTLPLVMFRPTWLNITLSQWDRKSIRSFADIRLSACAPDRVENLYEGACLKQSVCRPVYDIYLGSKILLLRKKVFHCFECYQSSWRYFLWDGWNWALLDLNSTRGISQHPLCIGASLLANRGHLSSALVLFLSSPQVAKAVAMARLWRPRLPRLLYAHVR